MAGDRSGKSMSSFDYVEKFKKEGNKVICFFSSLKTKDFAKNILTDGEIWCVRDVLVHFVSAEQNFIKLFKGIINNGKRAPDKFSIDKFNNHQGRLLAGLNPIELIDQLKRIDLIFYCG